MRKIERSILAFGLLLAGSVSLTSCDLYLLFNQLGANYYIPLGTNKVTFTYSDSVGTAALDWKGTIRASRVDKEDIPYEEVTYWYTDEQGNVLSETLTFLKNAMGNHAPVANPIYDAANCIDLVELKIDRGEGLEKVDMYILPNKFGILSWAFEGNSEANPLHYNPVAIYGTASDRRSGTFFMNQEGWELTFHLK